MTKTKTQKNTTAFYINYKNYLLLCKHFKKIILWNNNLQTRLSWLRHFSGIIKRPCSSMIFKNFACNCFMLLKWLCNRVVCLGRLMNYIRALIQILLSVCNVDIWVREKRSFSICSWQLIILGKILRILLLNKLCRIFCRLRN